MEQRTIVRIALDNQNKFTSFYDLHGVEEDEQALRIVHSLLDELRDDVLKRICSITSEKHQSIEEDLF